MHCHRNSHRNSKLSLILLFCIALSGCIGALGLRMLLVRGGTSELSAAAIRGGLGGEALAVTRAAQFGMGSVIAADAQLTRAAMQGIRVQLGRGAATIRGNAAMKTGSLNISMAEGGIMRHSKLIQSADRTGSISNQYIGTRQVGYTRFSSDNIRIDFFIRQGDSFQYSRMMYALRDPSGRSVSFFGTNHRYLGKATYGNQNMVGAGGSDATALSTAVLISVADFASTPVDEQCSPQLVIVRKAYFNSGADSEAPNRFWDSLYADCGAVENVSKQYQLFRLNEIRILSDIPLKLAKLEEFIDEFPDNQDARFLLDILNRRI